MTGRRFRIDRGATFTDVVARHPAGRPPTDVRTPPTVTRAVRQALSAPADGTGLHAVGELPVRYGGGVLVIANPGGGGYGPPSPDPHQCRRRDR